MKNKKMLILSIVTIILVIILSTLVLRSNIKKQNVDEKQKLYDYFHTDVGKWELVQKVCEKNGNWKNYPLTSNFIAKYNEKDGIFGDMQFDKVEVNPYKEGEYHFAYTSHIVVTQGLKKTAYIFYREFSKEPENSPKYEPGLEDVVITDIISLTDEKGNKLDDRFIFNDEKKLKLVKNIIDVDKNLQDSAAITTHFKEKYPYFLDLFIHYSPLTYNKIRFIENESDLNTNIAIFEVDSILEYKLRKYKVKFILDDKLYLDDCEVEKIDETIYKENHDNRDNRTARVYYKNSNWDDLKLTDSFKEKYTNEIGTFKDIDLIDIDEKMKETVIETNKLYIILCKFKDGSIHAYIRTIIEDDDDFLDEVTYEEIEYKGETIDELKNKYKNSEIKGTW